MSHPGYSAGVVPPRIASLDQFRGYTVLGMFVVNFLGAFKVTPALLKHHDTYCSYADTIMPQFFFAVGFAYRLTYLRRAASGGPVGLRWRFWRRNANLILLGAFIYLSEAAVEPLARSHRPSLTAFLAQALQEDLFQTLVHIGVTALWILPVIGVGAGARLGWACGSAGIHLLLSNWFYYDRVNTLGIDGGPLGFLTWAIPMIAGSLAHDLVVRHAEIRKAMWPLLKWGAVAMACGYVLSCLNLVTPPNFTASGGLSSWLVEPPFVPPTHPVNLWTMSQRAGSVSYLTFGAGFSLALYAMFVWACDVRRFQFGLWRTLGSNALAGYVIHILFAWCFSLMIGRRAPLETVLLTLLVYLMICYLSVRLLEKKNIYFRL